MRDWIFAGGILVVGAATWGHDVEKPSVIHLVTQADRFRGQTITIDDIAFFNARSEGVWMRDAKSPSLKIYLDRNIFDKLQYLSLMRNCYSDEAENKLGCTGSITLSVQQDRAIYELTTLHDATVRFD